MAKKNNHSQLLNKKWFIIGREKRYGPYSARQLVCFTYQGILNGLHICESLDGNSSTVNGVLRGLKN